MPIHPSKRPNLVIAAIAAVLIIVPICGADDAPSEPDSRTRPGTAPADAAAPTESETAREDGHGPVHKIIFWPINRVLDTLDIAHANVSLGPGFGFNVHPTAALQVGAGAYTVLRIGWRGRHFPITGDAGAEFGLGPLYAEAGPDREFTYLGAMGHFALVGAEIGVDPFEMVDLVSGVFFIDLKSDDW